MLSMASRRVIDEELIHEKSLSFAWSLWYVCVFCWGASPSYMKCATY